MKICVPSDSSFSPELDGGTVASIDGPGVVKICSNVMSVGTEAAAEVFLVFLDMVCSAVVPSVAVLVIFVPDAIACCTTSVGIIGGISFVEFVFAVMIKESCST